jgi:hypothetical protein
MLTTIWPTAFNFSQWLGIFLSYGIHLCKVYTSRVIMLTSDFI